MKKLVMYMGGGLRDVIGRIDDHIGAVREIRIRADKPLIVLTDNGEFFIGETGMRTSAEKAFIPSARDIALTAEILGGYSLYAFDEEVKNGFITIEGGHRIGICGKAIVENGELKTIRNIGSLNFRIAREVKGCADSVMKYIRRKEGIYNTLIVSPPGGGKTTLLRDIVRCVSNEGLTVGVCDERSEIGASFRGVAMNDIGIRTDIMDNCPKVKGIMLLLRSMAPRVIAVDEIGSQEDVDAIKTAVISGTNLLCTAHGSEMSNVIKYEGIFDRFILLYGAARAGKIKKICDGSFREMVISGD